MYNPAFIHMGSQTRNIQLDSLRAIAVGAVVAHHYLHAVVGPGQRQTLAWGALGVQIFFVLSGYLITTLLLQSRELADREEISRRKAWKRFTVRRALRIFPLHYVTLFLVWK